MRYSEFRAILDEQGETPCMAWPDAFFRDRDEDGRERYLQARALCRMCDIRLQCLEYAISNREEFGMWGGLTPRERGGISNGRAA